MKNKKIIFLIIAVIFLAIIVIYSLKSPEGISGGISVVGDQNMTDDLGAEPSGKSDEIVKILSMLSRIDLKNDFFENQFFLSLEDLSVSLNGGDMGRNNPFAAY